MRIVGALSWLDRYVRQLVVAVAVGLLAASSVFGQTGTYRSITWEKLKTSGPELKQVGWLAVRHAKDVESSPWSVGCETLDRDQAKFSVYKDYVGELGVKHARLQSGWAKCEKQKGVYEFAWLDECVYGLDEQGVGPWMCLCYGWFLRRMAGDRVRGIPSSVFTIIDLRYPNMLQSFGLIRSNLLHQFIYKRPSYYAVQHMAGFFDDTVKPVGLLPHESDGTDEITVAGFDKDGAPVLLFWQCDEVPSDAVQWDPVDLTIQHAKFQDPVYVEMITGKVYELDRSCWKAEGETVTFTKLPVWDSPVMVAERSQVDLED
jgi:hypothetical protein